MKTITLQAAVAVVIAVLTTVGTTVFTRYLLARPWCIQIESDMHQRIVYGADNCYPGDANPHQRHTAREQHFDGDAYSEYQ